MDKGILSIGSKERKAVPGKVTILLTTSSKPTELVVYGTNQVVTKLPVADSLSLAVHGSGSIALTGEGLTTQSVSAVVNGSGEIKAGAMKSKDAVATVNGTGSIQINASHSVTAQVNGTGHILYSGNPGEVKQNVYGTGAVRKSQ